MGQSKVRESKLRKLLVKIKCLSQKFEETLQHYRPNDDYDDIQVQLTRHTKQKETVQHYSPNDDDDDMTSTTYKTY